MQLLLETVIASWLLAINRLDQHFAQLDDDQLQKQVAPGKNRLFYLLGHLTVMHDRTLPMLGISQPLYPELGEAYFENPDGTFPDPLSATDLKAAWREVNSALTLGAENFSIEDWLRRHNAVSDEDFAKNPTRNRLAVFLNRTNHVSFHAGQVMLTK